MRRAECLHYQKADPAEMPKPTPWQVARHQVVDGISGAELIRMALTVCWSCPAQYDCARFAVEGLMVAGTWAMDIGDLKWLQAQDDGVEFVLMAEALGEPVQVVVRTARRS